MNRVASNLTLRSMHPDVHNSVSTSKLRDVRSLILTRKLQDVSVQTLKMHSPCVQSYEEKAMNRDVGSLALTGQPPIAQNFA